MNPSAKKSRLPRIAKGFNAVISSSRTHLSDFFRDHHTRSKDTGIGSSIELKGENVGKLGTSNGKTIDGISEPFRFPSSSAKVVPGVMQAHLDLVHRNKKPLKKSFVVRKRKKSHSRMFSKTISIPDAVETENQLRSPTRRITMISKLNHKPSLTSLLSRCKDQVSEKINNDKAFKHKSTLAYAVHNRGLRHAISYPTLIEPTQMDQNASGLIAVNDEEWGIRMSHISSNVEIELNRWSNTPANINMQRTLLRRPLRAYKSYQDMSALKRYGEEREYVEFRGEGEYRAGAGIIQGLQSKFAEEAMATEVLEATVLQKDDERVPHGTLESDLGQNNESGQTRLLNPNGGELLANTNHPETSKAELTSDTADPEKTKKTEERRDTTLALEDPENWWTLEENQVGEKIVSRSTSQQAIAANDLPDSNVQDSRTSDKSSQDGNTHHQLRYSALMKEMFGHDSQSDTGISSGFSILASDSDAAQHPGQERSSSDESADTERSYSGNETRTSSEKLLRQEAVVSSIYSQNSEESAEMFDGIEVGL